MSKESIPLPQRFAISPLIDSEIDIGGLGWVGMSPDADHETRMNVTAAVIARVQGYASIDRVKKIYLRSVAEHVGRDGCLRSLFRQHIQAYDNFYRAFQDRDDERIGVFAFDLAMVRSRASVELMLSTARQGFLLEPMQIARSLMEQFSYAVKVWDHTDHTSVFSIQPQSCIGELKRLNLMSGRAYGKLSELSHYNPAIHYRFIGIDNNEIESSEVIQRSWKFKIISSAWVFFILDLKYRIFEYFYGNHPNFKYLHILKDTVLPSFDTHFDAVESTDLVEIRRIICA